MPAPSAADLPKTYDPAAVEAEAYRVWLDEKCFHAEPTDSGEPYSIVIPPPNVTGALHLGHAINNTLQDILVRVHRMRGFNTVWIPGLDHAGIATQAVVEKQLKEKENKTRHDVGRHGLVERIWQWKQQFGDRIISQLKRLGCSCDWDRQRFTLDEPCARAVRETFFKLFKDGLVYRGKRLVNWDVQLQTSISDDEIYHENVKTFLWHIAYPIVDATSSAVDDFPSPAGRGQGEGGRKNASACAADPSQVPTAISDRPHPNPLPEGEGTKAAGENVRPAFMTVATTRPETLLGDTAVAVHSEDPRWNWAIGKFVALPLTGRLIPIIADDILVDPKFGSGVVKVTPAHDPNDYAVWQRHQNQPDAIDIINLMNPDGTLNAAAGERYAGLTMAAARKCVVEDLSAAGLLVKEEPYETQVGHSDRSKTPIQPYLSDQWFVKMAPLADPALKVVEDGTIQFFPERHKQQYLSWLGEKRDWPISRQLWWGHRIPVWTKSVADTLAVFHEIDQLSDDSFEEMLADEGGLNAIVIIDAASGERLRPTLTEMNHGLGRPVHLFLSLAPSCDSTKWERNGWIQDPDVLDTWFSSALWPHSTLGWPERTAALAKWYPTSVLLTGRDIITLWVARMVMTGIYNMGAAAASPSDFPSPSGRGQGEGERESTLALAEASSRVPTAVGVRPHPSPLPKGEGTRRERVRALGVPFFDVAINPTILDGNGERMSKSKGNGVDPVDIIDTHGADALRFTLATMATETQDVRLPVKKDAQGRNTSDRFDGGRNFCTKLWNAVRFALSNLEALPPSPTVFPSPSGRGEGEGERSGAHELTAGSFRLPMAVGARPHPSPLPEGEGTTAIASGRSLADRWIISRFNRTVAAVDASLAIYRFDQYATLAYDFFWNDLCAWYLEAIKPAMKDPARAAATGEVLAAVIDGSLRLLHPMVPFITETIWWRLNEVRPARGLPGLIECSPSQRLIKAKWPTAGPSDEDAEHVLPRLQAIVGVLRNLRNDHKVDAKKPVTVSLAPPGEEAARVAMENRELIETLANCVLADVQPNLPPPADAVRTTVNGCEVYVQGLVDPHAQAAVLEKKRADLTKQIAMMEGRLANEAYIAKAPPALVEQTQAQLAVAKAELATLG